MTMISSLSWIRAKPAGETMDSSACGEPSGGGLRLLLELFNAACHR